MSISLENIDYTYMKGTPFEKQALRGVSLTVEKGEFLGVIGHTGSGKSTLVQQLCGLLKPSAGTVIIDGVNLAGKGAEVKRAKNTVGMVFQYPEHQIFAETVFEDIAFGPRNKGMNAEETEAAVREAMAFVGLPYEQMAQRSPFTLSGGQMRRVAIAGVVAMEPDYLILDEPSAGLDPRSREQVFNEVLELYHKRGIAVVLVTHNMEEAVRYCQRLVVVSDGQILLDGDPKELFGEHREELLAVSMDVPQIYKLAACLRDSGLAIENTAEISELEQQILAARGRA